MKKLMLAVVIFLSASCLTCSARGYSQSEEGPAQDAESSRPSSLGWLMALPVGAALVLGMVAVDRSWSTRSTGLSSDLDSLIYGYRRRYGDTPTGADFLERIAECVRLRNTDGSQNLYAGIAVGSVANLFGASTRTSVGAGLFAAAVGWAADAWSKLGLDAGKTEQQINEEQRIASLVKEFATAQQNASALRNILLASAVVAPVTIAVIALA